MCLGNTAERKEALKGRAVRKDEEHAVGLFTLSTAFTALPRSMMIGVLGLACLSFAPRAPPLLTAQSATQRLRFELIAQAPSQDFRAEASNMFNNVRTPAALVAGACFGAVFALQPTATDAPLVGLAKRIHMLIGVSAFSAELISVLVSSISLGSLGTRPRARILEESPPTCVHEFIEGAYELEWVTTQFNFLVGLLGLAAMVGIRAWVAFSCPLFGKIAVGFVASALLTMLSFAQQSRDERHSSIGAMGVRYIQLLLAKAVRERSLLTSLALVVGLSSSAFLVEAVYKLSGGIRCPLPSLG